MVMYRSRFGWSSIDVFVIDDDGDFAVSIDDDDVVASIRLVSPS